LTSSAVSDIGKFQEAYRSGAIKVEAKPVEVKSYKVTDSSGKTFNREMATSSSGEVRVRDISNGQVQEATYIKPGVERTTITTMGPKPEQVMQQQVPTMTPIVSEEKKANLERFYSEIQKPVREREGYVASYSPYYAESIKRVSPSYVSDVNTAKMMSNPLYFGTQIVFNPKATKEVLSTIRAGIQGESKSEAYKSYEQNQKYLTTTSLEK
jgi:hypothetical protein